MTMKKSFPFQPPEGYFEALTERTIRQTQEPRVRPMRGWGRIAAAIVVILSSAAIYLQSWLSPEPCISFACLLEKTETLDLENESHEWLEDDSDWMMFLDAQELNSIDFEI
jgi:hypothetical protein